MTIYFMWAYLAKYMIIFHVIPNNYHFKIIFLKFTDYFDKYLEFKI